MVNKLHLIPEIWDVEPELAQLYRLNSPLKSLGKVIIFSNIWALPPLFILGINPPTPQRGWFCHRVNVKRLIGTPGSGAITVDISFYKKGLKACFSHKIGRRSYNLVFQSGSKAI